MCTSIAVNTPYFCFGRNMDLEYHFGERVVVTPRDYPISFRQGGCLKRHYAIIGMAAVYDGFPLYADAVNEKGLCMAGLAFQDNAVYFKQAEEGKTGVSPFEIILWVLGRCADTQEAVRLLSKTSVIDLPFSDSLPLTPLHWHIADKNTSIVLEVTSSGTHIYNNAFRVLTNNPPFEFHAANASQYLNLTPNQPQNAFGEALGIKPFGVGLGGLGLPGDFSPASRFVKSAYLKQCSVSGQNADGGISQVFHLLEAVSMPDGAVIDDSGKYHITTYSAVMDADRGIYFYTTYYNRRITAVDMHREKLNTDALIAYPLQTEQDIAWEN